MSLPGICPVTNAPHREATLADAMRDWTIGGWPHAVCVDCRTRWLVDYDDGEIVGVVPDGGCLLCGVGPDDECLPDCCGSELAVTVLGVGLDRKADRVDGVAHRDQDPVFAPCGFLFTARRSSGPLRTACWFDFTDIPDQRLEPGWELVTVEPVYRQENQ